jgi:hypothetical protein
MISAIIVARMKFFTYSYPSRIYDLVIFAVVAVNKKVVVVCGVYRPVAHFRADFVFLTFQFDNSSSGPDEGFIQWVHAWK